MAYLIDTDWLIDALRDHGAARDVLDALSDRGLGVSIVSLGELYEGIVGQPDETHELALASRFVARFDVVGLTASIMLTFARVKLDLQRQGRPLDDLDLLIAATALDTDRVLITRNRRHFDRVAGLKIY